MRWPLRPPPGTGLPGRMIPIPSEVSAGCGLAWCVPAEERGALLDASRAAAWRTRPCTRWNCIRKERTACHVLPRAEKR
ncbi:MAG: DUF3343 domain-containing protein [Eggerthellaceae bacterium]